MCRGAGVSLNDVPVSSLDGFGPFSSPFYLVAWLVGLVGLFWILDWISYGFDYDRELHGTRRERLAALLISIPFGILATIWCAVERLRKWCRREK